MVLLDMNGFLKLIEVEEATIGRPIYIPILPAIKVAPMGTIPTDITIQRWEFTYDHQMEKDLYKYKFQGTI